jgi:cell fate (sporulation/competence/biofilm development) regulator YmcA (YheA/YmcA/DUF963 family)
MSENINLQKQVYNKGDYSKVINTSFTQLGVKNIQQQIELQPTVEEFFALYNELFYTIPELGKTNSHEYLIKTSSEYVNFDINQEEIIELQAEIAQLRTDLLNTQKQVVELQTGTILANPQ